MEQENIYIHRFDDRREYNDGPPDGTDERRGEYRRDSDQYRADLKSVFDISVEDTVTDEEVGNVLGPVLERIKAGNFKQENTR